jgi:hypothetical protein
MSEDKQIFEMAMLISEGARPAVEDADALYNAGYRKASDVAREIFEEIDEELGGLMNTYHKSQRFSDADVIRYARCVIAELKKKYTEGGK